MPDRKPDASSGEGSAWNAVRLLSLCAAMLGLAASLWAAPGVQACGACGASSDLARGIPLAWIGLAYYGLLATVILWRPRSRWVAPGFCAALGVHVVLAVLLVRERHFCAACVTAGAGAVLGALVNLGTRPRPRLVAASFVAAVFATGGVAAARWLPAQAQPPMPLAAQAAPSNAGQVRLILYEREGCRHCIDFEENVLPPLLQALGGKLDIERRDPSIDMETPTIIVEGRTSRTFAGGADERTLEDAVRELQ